MEICDTKDKAFIDIANILLSKEVQREFGWPVSVEPGIKFLYNGYGFVSFRFKDDIYYFDYGYIFPQFRGHGEYKRLFLQREVICGGKLCKINTKNP